MPIKLIIPKVNGMSEIWFYGYGNTASIACKILVEKKYQVRVCTPNCNALEVTAKKLDIPCTNIRSHFEEIHSLPRPEIIISFLFPVVIPKTVLTKSFYGGINFHPAPLPQYRGVHCATFAILNRENHFGTTCHYMTENIDDGPILGQNTFPIMLNDTEISLETKAKHFLLTLFKQVISQAL